MSTQTINVVKNSTEVADQEKELVDKIKPRLDEFLIRKQVDKAAETAQENSKAVKEYLSDEKVVEVASSLAMRAFLDLKLWETNRPPLDMAWTRGVTLDGRKITEKEARQERAQDISGFSSYLVREYFTMKKEIQNTAYRNPLLEANLEFFWNKFCADIKLLLEIDAKMKTLGNQGILLPNENSH